MTNYVDPSRWIVLQYRPGAGGKILILCLMTIDCVAHWDPEVENNTISHVDSLKKYWNSLSVGGWVATEPVIHWHRDFYSRAYPRGDDTDQDCYNRFMNASNNTHFKTCWNSGKILLEYIHKSKIPVWHQGSKILKLDADWHDPMYRNALLTKIYPWDSNSGMGTSLLDHPSYQPSTNNVLKFNNQYKFGPFASADQWLEFVREKYPAFKLTIESPDLMMPDLLNFNKIQHFVESIANTLNGKFDLDVLKATHSYWIAKQEEFTNLILSRKNLS